MPPTADRGRPASSGSDRSMPGRGAKAACPSRSSFQPDLVTSDLPLVGSGAGVASSPKRWPRDITSKLPGDPDGFWSVGPPSPREHGRTSVKCIFLATALGCHWHVPPCASRRPAPRDRVRRPLPAAPTAPRHRNSPTSVVRRRKVRLVAPMLPLGKHEVRQATAAGTTGALPSRRQAVHVPELAADHTQRQIIQLIPICIANPKNLREGGDFPKRPAASVPARSGQIFQHGESAENTGSRRSRSWRFREGAFNFGCSVSIVPSVRPPC